MPLPINPEGYIQCPYEDAHVILESRIQFHLVKCKKNHAESRLVECPFNSTHKIPEIELNCHKMYLCPDRKKIDTFICNTEDTKHLFPVQTYEVSSSEDWDDAQFENYDPMEHCKSQPVLLNLAGATPSDRKTFRAEERQRYRQVIGAVENEEKKDKGQTRLPQTKPISQKHEGTGRKKSPPRNKGKGRGHVILTD